MFWVTMLLIQDAIAGPRETQLCRELVAWQSAEVRDSVNQRLGAIREDPVPWLAFDVLSCLRRHEFDTLDIYQEVARRAVREVARSDGIRWTLFTDDPMVPPELQAAWFLGLRVEERTQWRGPLFLHTVATPSDFGHDSSEFDMLLFEDVLARLERPGSLQESDPVELDFQFGLQSPLPVGRTITELYADEAAGTLDFHGISTFEGRSGPWSHMLWLTVDHHATALRINWAMFDIHTGSALGLAQEDTLLWTHAGAMAPPRGYRWPVARVATASAGLVVAAAGAAIAAGTFLSFPWNSPPDGQVLEGANIAGWALGGVGGAIAVSGLSIPGPRWRRARAASLVSERDGQDGVSIGSSDER